jgi:hypothetical protein
MLETCDLDELLCMIAPRAFFVVAGETDGLFPVDGVCSIVDKAKDHYALDGVPECFDAVIHAGGHTFPDIVKARAYAFLDLHLKNSEVAPK